MNKKEEFENNQNLLNVYSGILFNYKEFKDGNNDKITYDFSAPELKVLKEKYKLEEIAKIGSEFKKVKRLVHYFAPKLTHDSNYDNHVDCNSLKLLEYSLNNKDHGINCLNKAKILQECCLALGIYARRVVIMPYSPYDFDNHVVTEIYDRKMKKWIMLDLTTDGYFVDLNNTPLSLIEIRDKFSQNELISFTTTTSRCNFDRLKEKYSFYNQYICKNSFYYNIGKESKFGEPSEYLTFCPNNYSIKTNEIQNYKYRIDNIPKDFEKYDEAIDFYKKILEKAKKSEEDELTSISSMLVSPID